MSQQETITKSIPTTELDPQTRHLVREAGQGKIRVIFEENGNAVAVVMPVESGQEWEREREQFFDSIREMQKTANLAPEEADELALEAVKAVRAQAS